MAWLYGPLPAASGDAGASTGDLSKTLAALTLSSAATLALQGSLSVTLGALTLSSAGTLPISGSLAQTLAALALSSDATITQPAGATPAASVPGGVGRRRRAFVEVDGRLIPVRDIGEAQSLLKRATAQAKAEAPKKARQAVEKAVQKAVEPVLEPPKLDMVGEYMSQIGAQYEAAQAEIAEIYAKALRDAEDAYQRLLDDDDEAIFVLTH